MTMISSKWDSVPLGRLFKKESRDPEPWSGVVTAFRDGLVMLRSKRRLEGFTEAIQETGYQGIKKGDLVIHSMDGFAGAIGVAQDNGKSSPVYLALTPRNDSLVEPRFYAYVLRNYALSGVIESFSQGVRQRSTDFRWSIAKTVPVPVPQPEQQRVIADFLDRETAEIDAFIADQERLIELLEERRAAKITHAVTKGLDPNAPMKDSGIEWLGKVPTHWSIRKLKTLADLVTAKTGNQLLSLGLENVQSWTGELNEELLDNDVANPGIEFHRNDVLFGKLRPNLAKVWVATQSGAAIGDFLVIRPGLEVVPKFLAYLMRTPPFISVVVRSMYGAKMPRTSWDFVKNVAWSIPPIEEQNRVIGFLDSEITNIAAAIDDAREAIALSRERRAALISAAVTGQLDVSKAHSRSSADEVLEQGVRV